MGIVPSTFKQATCTRLLLWFALLLLSSMELTDMVDITVLAMPDMDMELTHMPMVDMDTHTPMEVTTERDLLMLSQRLMLMLLFCMELTDMVDMVLAMPDMDMELTHMLMVDTDTHMPTEDTMERDPLMLSQRLMPLTCMELMDMLDTHMPLDTLMVVTHMLMVDMDTHMPMESKL